MIIICYKRNYAKSGSVRAEFNCILEIDLIISSFLNVEPPSRANFFGRWAIHPAFSQTDPAASPTRLRDAYIWERKEIEFTKGINCNNKAI